jgi:hypothetical protein
LYLASVPITSSTLKGRGDQGAYDFAVNARAFSFVGAASGGWCVTRISRVVGEGLKDAKYVDVVGTNVSSVPPDAVWVLRGTVSYERYLTGQEKNRLVSAQPPLGRPEATCAALIPIKKSQQWWQLAQDERRRIFEDRSHHIQTGLKYLPAIARRLHHSYDLDEPFDFLTWFEYSPEHASAFEDLVVELRRTEEWKYVIREVDVRLTLERTRRASRRGGQERVESSTLP